MKKFIIVLLLLILSGCERSSILNTVYISSIGIEYVDDEYIGYFYSPPIKDLGKDENSDDDSTVYVIKDKELSNIFEKMFSTVPANINMYHLKTMILNDSFKDIDVLLDYFKFNNNLSYNFHVFITVDKLEEIYKYKTMSNINNLYSFLNSPSLIDYDEYGVSRCHFLTFANNYLNENRYLLVPLVSIEENSLKEEEFQLVISGYSNTEYLYFLDEYLGISLLSSEDKEVSVNNNIVQLYNYKVDFKIVDDIYNVNISYKKTNVSGDFDISNYINQEIEKYFNYVIYSEGELYLIKQYNYLYNKNINTKKFIININ